jgi:hypothetical protein
MNHSMDFNIRHQAWVISEYQPVHAGGLCDHRRSDLGCLLVYLIHNPDMLYSGLHSFVNASGDIIVFTLSAMAMDLLVISC